jgi:hypothetical protein
MPDLAREQKLREVLEGAAVRHVWPVDRALPPGPGLVAEPEIFGFGIGGDPASDPRAEVYFGPAQLPPGLVVSRATSLTGLSRDEIIPIPCGGLVPFAIAPGSPGGHPNVVAKFPGTLGGWVSDRDGAVVLLSCNHVLADLNAAQTGDPTLVGMELPGDRCGSLKRFVPLAIAPAVNYVDAAVSTPAIPGVSPPIAGGVPPSRGMRVEKVGRRTGRTEGTIEAVTAPVQFSYPMGPGGSWVGVNFQGVFRIVGQGGPFALPGDSGAFVVEKGTDRFVGLLFGGERAGAYAFACPMAALTATLGLAL